MVRDSRLGQEPDDGPYLKLADGLGEHGGCVYTVCGCSGTGGAADEFPKHPATAVTRGGYGSMVITIDGLRLKARFLRSTGVDGDSFSIDKTADATAPPPLSIARHTNGTLISWPTSKPAFALRHAPAVPTTNWLPLSAPVSTNGRRNVVTLPITGDQQFYQLQRPP